MEEGVRWARSADLSERNTDSAADRRGRTFYPLLKGAVGRGFKSHRARIQISLGSKAFRRGEVGVVCSLALPSLVCIWCFVVPLYCNLFHSVHHHLLTGTTF